jgi:hypothetical protein
MGMVRNAMRRRGDAAIIALVGVVTGTAAGGGGETAGVAAAGESKSPALYAAMN